MEFKTCEQVVLNKLERLENENAELVDAVTTLVERNYGLENRLEKLIRFIKPLLKQGDYNKDIIYIDESSTVRDDDWFSVVEEIVKIGN